MLLRYLANIRKIPGKWRVEMLCYWATWQVEDQVESCDVENVKPESEEFEDDEFKEDKKTLNDQGEGEGTNSCSP